MKILAMLLVGFLAFKFFPAIVMQIMMLAFVFFMLKGIFSKKTFKSSKRKK